MKADPLILTQYDKRRRLALAERDERERAAYAAVPRLEAITDEKREIALALGRALLAGGDLDALDKAARESIAMLDREREALMKKHGLPADYFEPRWGCPACRDTGFTDNSRARMCECLKQRLLQEAYASSNIQNGETFDAFRTDIFPQERQRKMTVRAKELLERYADSLPNNDVMDVLLIGTPGLGKTFLANCVAERALSRGFSAVKLTAYNLVEGYLSALRARTAPDDMTEADLLVIDDLGTEPMIPNVTLEYLFSIINERQNAKKNTVIATNLALSDILSRYGERLFSRLTSPALCSVLSLEGDDLRLLSLKRK